MEKNGEKWRKMDKNGEKCPFFLLILLMEGGIFF